MKGLALACVLASGPLARCQDLLWEFPDTSPWPIATRQLRSFIDYDHDGNRDFLRAVTLPMSSQATFQIASGHDGSTLWGASIGSSANVAVYAGDVDGDGEPELAILHASVARFIRILSTATGAVLWQVTGPASGDFGESMLGDLDTDGDGLSDLVTITTNVGESDVYVYDSRGSLRYQLPCWSQTRIAESIADMGDIDGDGCDDLLVGCLEATGRGLQWLVSGKTGATIHESFGLLPGDHTAAHVSNLGDIDGDGVTDYAAFPYVAAQRLIAVAYSGRDGSVIRSWTDYANSVVTSEDFDQDGVNDIVTGADWVVTPQLSGRTYCRSGRDGSELWRVDVTPFVPASSGSNGTTGWMSGSASLGAQSNNPYPIVAWLEYDTHLAGNSRGRTRAFGGARAGQGPVTGTACTSSGTLPLIGVRKLGTGATNTGFRTTVAKTHANALAMLNFAFAPLPSPIDLTPFGFAGCTVYVEPAVSFLQVTGTIGNDRGYAAVDLPHPLSAAATGTDVVAQWLVLDPLAPAHAATQMHAIRLP